MIVQPGGQLLFRSQLAQVFFDHRSHFDQGPRFQAEPLLRGEVVAVEEVLDFIEGDGDLHLEFFPEHFFVQDFFPDEFFKVAPAHGETAQHGQQFFQRAGFLQDLRLHHAQNPLHSG